MSSASNGIERNRMTGSSTEEGNICIHRLSVGAVGYDQPNVKERMIVRHIGGTSGVAFHEPGGRSILTGIVRAGPQVFAGNGFHSPQNHLDTAQYLNVYTTAAGSSAVGPFSPRMHGTTLTPYPAFYGNQYPSYSSDIIHTLDPQFNSYSSVLQSMGTHAAQSQVPRSPYAPDGASAIGQYSLLSMTPAVSMHVQEELQYRREQRDSDIQRRYSTGVLKEEKHHFSVPSLYPDTSRASFLSPLCESPSHKRELSASGQDSYKVPCGGELGLKHRFLQPADSSSSTGISQHCSLVIAEEPFIKRTKTDQSVTEDNSERLACKHVEIGHSGSASSLSLQYPPHFMKGSIIQLGNGKLKRVEDLETDDFIVSADVSSDLKIDSSTVVNIEENEAQGTAALGFVVGEHKFQVTVEATVEHPFFVFGQGWSSCEPSWTLQRYGLECRRLTVGDVCISLTHKEVHVRAAAISQQQKEQNRFDGHTTSEIESNSKSSGSPHQNRNRSLGHSQIPGLQSQSFTCKSASRHRESSAFVKQERLINSSSAAQIPSASQTQEQKFLASTTT